ncbi:hypothetical protein [Streptomyces caniferus]|uniref:hypothetical protein n=1 Tax=Streptomyces caniferus TaxID=285557 RepID=UPI00381EE3A2
MIEHQQDSGSLDELRSALDALDQCGHLPWSDVARIAGKVAPLAWDELKARDLWGALPEHDQAAMHRALTIGHCISSHGAFGTDPLRYWGSDLDDLRTEVAYFATWCKPSEPDRWPEALDRSQRAAEALRLYTEFRELPAQWQRTVLSRLEPEPHYEWENTPAPTLPTLGDACAEATERVARGESPNYPAPRPSYGARICPHELYDRFEALPPGWQIEAFRHMATGVTPLRAASDMGIAINIVRVFGVRLAWNARPLPPLR